MVSKGQIVGIDWHRIARLLSYVLTHMNSLTATRCHIKASSTFSELFFEIYDERFKTTDILKSFYVILA